MTSLVAGVRCSFRGKDAGSVRIRSDTGATEDAASGRAARLGGSAMLRQALLTMPLAHGGTIGLVVELSAAFGVVALGLAAWLGARKERE